MSRLGVSRSVRNGVEILRRAAVSAASSPWGVDAAFGNRSDKPLPVVWLARVSKLGTPSIMVLRRNSRRGMVFWGW